MGLFKAGDRVKINAPGLGWSCHGAVAVVQPGEGGTLYYVQLLGGGSVFLVSEDRLDLFPLNEYEVWGGDWFDFNTLRSENLRLKEQLAVARKWAGWWKDCAMANSPAMWKGPSW